MSLNRSILNAWWMLSSNSACFGQCSMNRQLAVWDIEGTKLLRTEGLMNSSLRVLHLEDSKRDAELIESTLEAEGLDCQIVHVKNQEEFETAIARETFDVILSDYSLPHYNGLSALDFARQKAPSTPFILLSGTLGEELAVASVKTGAADYILKQSLNRLGTAVQRAVREAQERTERKRAEEA